MKNLNFVDVVFTLIIWTGAGVITYFHQEPIVPIIALICAYYLTKWIILKKEKVCRCSDKEEKREDKQ